MGHFTHISARRREATEVSANKEVFVSSFKALTGLNIGLPELGGTYSGISTQVL